MRPASLPAPTRGWIANGNLAAPEPGGAAVLENWFPTATSAIQRRGAEIYATLGDGSKPVTALFSYHNGGTEQIFGATEDTIYDITTIVTAINYVLITEDGDFIATSDGMELSTLGEDSTIGLEVVENLSGGDWIFPQFATSGGVFIVGVNGEDDQLIYDGTTWYPISTEDLNKLDYDGGTFDFTVGSVLTGGTSGATATIVKVIGDTTSGTLWLGDITSGPFQNDEAITDAATGAAVANGANSVLFNAMDGVDPADLSYVWPFKNRLFYAEKDSLNAWYLAVDSLTGTATKLPLGGVFTRGGSLLFGASWSLDAGDGLSEQCVFVSTEGEVAVYAGSNPGDANAWTRVGTYRIGRPLGKNAWIKAGGDLVIATDVGFVPLSQAIQRDYAALSPSAVSAPIETAWNEAVALRSSQEWHCDVWPSNQMVVVAPPTVNDEPAEMYVANSRTGAWAKYTGWSGTCLIVFKERMFYGSQDGKVVEANIGGLDLGETYTSRYVPLFTDFGHPGSKVATMARAVLRSQVPLNERLSIQSEYHVSLPPAPAATAGAPGGTWGTGIWGETVWGVRAESLTYQNWRSVSGKGFALSAAIQITSGSLNPVDAEIIRMDVLYQPGGILA